MTRLTDEHMRMLEESRASIVGTELLNLAAAEIRELRAEMDRLRGELEFETETRRRLTVCLEMMNRG